MITVSWERVGTEAFWTHAFPKYSISRRPHLWKYYRDTSPIVLLLPWQDPQQIIHRLRQSYTELKEVQLKVIGVSIAESLGGRDEVSVNDAGLEVAFDCVDALYHLRGLAFEGDTDVAENVMKSAAVDNAPGLQRHIVLAVATPQTLFPFVNVFIPRHVEHQVRKHRKQFREELLGTLGMAVVVSHEREELIIEAS